MLRSRNGQLLMFLWVGTRTVHQCERVDIGYPLDKAIAYVELRKPYSLNDLSMQKISCDTSIFSFFPLLNLFFDRRTIHKMLKDNVLLITFCDSPPRESKFLTT